MPTSDDYTPSTDEVRINYIGTHPSLATSPHQVERPGEFDRWLESVRAEERERIARNIEAFQSENEDDVLTQGAWSDGVRYGLRVGIDAAQVAREGA